MPNQIKSNQIKSNQIKSNQIKSNQIKSNQIKSNQIKSICGFLKLLSINIFFLHFFFFFFHNIPKSAASVPIVYVSCTGCATDENSIWVKRIDRYKKLGVTNIIKDPYDDDGNPLSKELGLFELGINDNNFETIPRDIKNIQLFGGGQSFAEAVNTVKKGCLLLRGVFDGILHFTCKRSAPPSCENWTYTGRKLSPEDIAVLNNLVCKRFDNRRRRGQRGSGDNAREMPPPPIRN